MTRPLERLRSPRKSNPWEPPQRPYTDGGRTDGGGGGGDKNPPTDRTNWDQPTDGGDGAAPQGVEEMEDAKAEAGTEKRAGGVGRQTAHPTFAASAPAEGVPVSRARAG